MAMAIASFIARRTGFRFVHLPACTAPYSPPESKVGAKQCKLHKENNTYDRGHGVVLGPHFVCLLKRVALVSLEVLDARHEGPVRRDQLLVASGEPESV